MAANAQGTSSGPARVWSDVMETPTLTKQQIVFTVGSTVTIDAPADKVFAIIMSFDKYGEWNTWCPKFEFKDGERPEVGSTGTMHVNMEAQNRQYEIPAEILELEYEPQQYKLSWRGKLLPAWAGKAERVQIVTPVEGSNNQQSQLKQWESMSGFASYVFKHIMGIPKQLADSNALYSNDIKKHAEKLQGSISTSASV
ncbi:hypothetical protein JX265_003824 [Neoarthrinium moseri]|uniref:SRPBCC domain-containing protein n=1 Tax=Neoarthrinium moseri TaxID=1658444 RepID=A0A9P9WSX0_9PEZI|nr:hypothetical protein JX265_003824 [Neoarthrinium moseri]